MCLRHVFIEMAITMEHNVAKESYVGWWAQGIGSLAKVKARKKKRKAMIRMMGKLEKLYHLLPSYNFVS